MAIQTQEQMKQTHGHLKTTRPSLERRPAGCWEAALAWLVTGWWLHPRRPRNAVVDHVSTSPCGRAPSPTATAGTCQAALPRPSVLPGAALIACANKAHTVKGDGVAEACAVRTHAACTSTLVALRPPLRGCEPFFKISFLALGSRSTSGSCRGQTTVRRDATVSSSITSRARIDSAAWAINPDHPSLNSTCGCPAPTAVLPLFSVVVLLQDRHNSR